MAVRKNNNLKVSDIKGTDYLSIIILALVVSIIPLVVYLKVVNIDGVLRFAWTGTETQLDFFSYWKAQLIMLCASLIAVIFIYQIARQKFEYFKNKIIYIPLMIYTVMVLLSAIFSEHKTVAFIGFIDRFEGAWVLLSYVILVLASMLFIKNERASKYVLIPLFISCIALAIIGLSQFYGSDFFQTAFGRKLILPKALEDQADKLGFIFSGQQIMYTTMYNPNYVGSYAALLLPVSAGLFYSWIEKKYWRGIIAGLIFVTATFVLFLGGMSRAGLMGGIGSLIIFIILFRKKIKNFWLYTIALVLVLFGIYLTMDLTSNGQISKEFINTLPSAVNDEISDGGSKDIDPNEPSKFIESIEIKGVAITVKTKTESLTIVHNNGKLIFTGTDGKMLDVILEDGVYHFTDKAYSLYKIVVKGSGIFDLLWNDIQIPIIVADNNLHIVTQEGIAINQISKPKTFGFKGYELFASGRGYIWSRSIPLMKDTLILGHGPDTFAIYFPQYEIDAKINYLKSATMIVDKPHNWYLQMGINTGVISLIAMLVFLGWYIIKGFFVWVKDVGNGEKAIGASILCGVVGYCIAALFNDSTVSVAPVFWVLLGIGISFLYKYSPSEKKRKMLDRLKQH